MASIRVFVSYAREESRFLGRKEENHRWMVNEDAPDALIPWLCRSRLLREKGVSFWYDQKDLAPADEFRKRIEEEIDHAHIAIVLLSSGFLNSDFIQEIEFPRIRARAERGEVKVITILVEPCLWQTVDFFSSRQMLPGKPTPLSDYLGSDREWPRVRDEILQGLLKAVEKIIAPRPPFTFKLVVNNESGSGVCTPGKVVELRANPAPDGQVFDRWVGASVADATAPNTMLKMPTEDTAVTATFKPLPAFKLTVSNGSGSDVYTPGKVIGLRANPAPDGQVFDRWVGASVADATAPNTTLEMPAEDTVVTATFKPVTCARPEPPSDLKPDQGPPLAASTKWFIGIGVGVVAALICLSTFLFRQSASDNPPPQPTNSFRMAAAAKDRLVGVFTNLKRTTHNPDPYAVSIDLTNNLMTMENHQARWEFNLRDLDPSSVKAHGWSPGPIDARTGNESCQIIADCLLKQPLVKWGTPDGKGGYQTTPSMRSDILFEVYQGKGDKFGRDTNAENGAVEALRTLIPHFSAP